MCQYALNKSNNQIKLISDIKDEVTCSRNSQFCDGTRKTVSSAGYTGEASALNLLERSSYLTEQANRPDALARV